MTPGFTSFPKYEQIDFDGNVRLLEPLTYIAKSGRVFVVPAGSESDFESRPTLLPAVVHYLLGPQRTTALAALLHDELYKNGPELEPPVGSAEADALYYEALSLTAPNPFSGVRYALRGARNTAGRSLAWAGLRLLGWRAWNRHRTRS